MADDRIEVEIVLDDGSIQKGFATIRQEGKKTSSFLQRSFSAATDRGFSKPLDRVKDSIFNLRNALGAAVAVVGGGAFVRTITQAAAEQEEAVNALNISLQTAGEFSQEASQGFQDLARELQANSRFGDEVILQQAALARNFTNSNEQAQDLIKTAIDLSEATGISLDSAVRNLGKTLSGLTGELGEAVPQIRGLTAEQLKAGEAINVLAQRFGGAALGATRTFAGALAQLRNTFGDFLERIGSTITESPQVIALLNALSITFNNLTKNLAGSGAGFDVFFKNLVLNGAAAANSLIESFAALAQIPSFLEFTFTQAQIAILRGINFILAGFNGIGNVISKLIGSTVRFGDTVQSNLSKIAELEGTLETIADGGVEVDRSFDLARQSVNEFATTFQQLSVASQETGPAASPLAPTVQAVDKDIKLLREKVLSLRDATQTAVNEAFFNPEAVALPSVFEINAAKSESALNKLQMSLQKTRDTAVQTSAQITTAVQNGIANSIANSVAAVTQALAAGENAFSAFGKAALATIGDLAVQLGQTLILSGIGIDALKGLAGAAAIAAGIALVAVGTLIKGAAGGGAPNPSGGSSVTPPLADLEPDGISDTVEDNARVNVNIEGNIFDGDETGLRIADILKEQGFNNAVVS